MEYEGLPITCFQCGKYGHHSTAYPDKQNPQRANDGNSMSIPPTNVAVDKEGSPVVANKSREKFGPWMVVTRKRRAKVVVDRENISDSERNQQNNFSTASHFAALADDPYTNAAVEVVVQNPIFVPPQRPTTSITDHFNIRKNFTLKTSTTLKLHNHLAKGKQVAKAQLSRPRQPNSKTFAFMHASLRHHIPRTLSHNTHVPIPNPLEHTPCLPVEPTFTLTTLDPHNHTAVIFSIKKPCDGGQPVRLLK